MTFVRTCASVCGSSGRPGFFASSSCFASKGIGFGGGAICDTTGRSIVRAGGATAWTLAFAPNTLVRAGATGAAVANAPALTSVAGTETATLDTDCELAMALVGTAVTAPFTVRLA